MHQLHIRINFGYPRSMHTYGATPVSHFPKYTDTYQYFSGVLTQNMALSIGHRALLILDDWLGINDEYYHLWIDAYRSIKYSGSRLQGYKTVYVGGHYRKKVGFTIFPENLREALQPKQN